METTPQRLSPQFRLKLSEWGRKGGMKGSGETKRATALRAWANPDPARRPGRKKGTKNRTRATPVAPRPNAGQVLGGDIERALQAIREA